MLTNNKKCILQQIIISDLELKASIGIHPEERAKLQPVIISVTLDTNYADATDIKQVLNYSEVELSITNIVELKHYDLLESLTSSIALQCLKFNKVTSVQVIASKPMASSRCKNISIKQIWK